jgi:hypothetical protein
MRRPRITWSASRIFSVRLSIDSSSSFILCSVDLLELLVVVDEKMEKTTKKRQKRPKDKEKTRKWPKQV